MNEGNERERKRPETHFIQYLENCTARWKTSCKETSCESDDVNHSTRRNANNFAVGLRRKKLSKIAKAIL